VNEDGNEGREGGGLPFTLGKTPNGHPMIWKLLVSFANHHHHQSENITQASTAEDIGTVGRPI